MLESFEAEVSVKIDQFDGPLALLLHLIQKDEIDIRQLDITHITGQYLNYLQKMQDLNFDIAGEYLYMATTLLYIKSKAAVIEPNSEEKLLTEEDFEISSKAELIRRLEELEHYQRLGERLWNVEKKGHEIFLKPRVDKKVIADSILTPIDIQQLTMTMIEWMQRENRKYGVVKREKLSIKEKLVELKHRLQVNSRTSLHELIDTSRGSIDVVVTFISLLELARLKKLNIFQNEDRGNIYVDVVSSLDNFDVDTATGFETEPPSTEASAAPTIVQ
ncbi:MAG: segregation/condensation protein A [Bacteriovoracaceae bacterium]|nr:segregation/condensation protein A [Bacteriovoracaceae bacterium]